MRLHKNQDDLQIKPQHRVGQGLLQVVVEEQVPVDDNSQDDSGQDDSVGDEDDPGTADEEDELLSQENYTALKLVKRFLLLLFPSPPPLFPSSPEFHILL